MSQRLAPIDCIEDMRPEEEEEDDDSGDNEPGDGQDGQAKARHRGKHPADISLFADSALPALRTAVAELSWLLSRGYAETAALALVGNRHELRKRQRVAVARCACGDTALAGRLARRIDAEALQGKHVAIDGLNCIITLETALSGGAVLRGRDRVHRDLASVHGTYRRVAETQVAITLVASWLRDHGVASVRWLLDRPVSNSGRLKGLIEACAPPGLAWHTELVYSPDRELAEAASTHDIVVASADSGVIDRVGPWLDLPGAVLAHAGMAAWVVDLAPDSTTAV